VKSGNVRAVAEMVGAHKNYTMSTRGAHSVVFVHWGRSCKRQEMSVGGRGAYEDAHTRVAGGIRVCMKGHVYVC
jgi:hypothetical protein